MRTAISLFAIILTLTLTACDAPVSTTVGSAKSNTPMRNIARTNFTPPPALDGWPGLALFDFDNDDDIDIFATNSVSLPNMVYLNDGEGNFSFAANRTGLAFDDDSAVCTGVGDFDNDGWLDLLIGRQSPFFGNPAPNHNILLMKNMGIGEDGTVRFEDVTEQAGLADIDFAMSFGVGDIDDDGLLDIYVGRYNMVDLNFSTISYLPDTPNVLLRNTGVVDGAPTFEDITESAGVAGTTKRGLAPTTQDIISHVPTWSVMMSDVNVDGLIDILALQEIPGGVDLFINNGDLTFTAVQQDLLDKHGGWMGVTSADFNRDGNLDYFFANIGADAKGPGIPNHIADSFKLESGYPYHRLITAQPDGTVTDLAPDTRVIPGDLPPTNILGGTGLAEYEFGFGCAFFDMQNDGWPDLHWVGDIILSGIIREGQLRRDFHGVGRYLENNGDGSFTDRTAEMGMHNWSDDLPLDYGYNRSGRALAAIDLNGDGFEDICRSNSFLEVNLEDTFECLLNPALTDNHWITIRLRGTRSNSFGIGARVVATAGDRTYVGEVHTTTSAFTAVHPQVHFGLGDSETLDTLTIHWPSGTITERTNVPADRIITINEDE